MEQESKTKKITICMLSVILMFLMPFILLFLLFSLEKETIFAVKCFGNCAYKIEKGSNFYLYGPSVFDVQNILKYKDDKNTKVAYIVCREEDSGSYQYTILNYKKGEYKNYSSLEEMNFTDSKIFKKENDFVNLYG